MKACYYPGLRSLDQPRGFWPVFGRRRLRIGGICHCVLFGICQWFVVSCQLSFVIGKRVEVRLRITDNGRLTVHDSGTRVVQGKFQVVLSSRWVDPRQRGRALGE